MDRSKKILATCAIAAALALGSAGPALAGSGDTVTIQDRHTAGTNQTVTPPTEDDRHTG